jgi:hypothetical protein
MRSAMRARALIRARAAAWGLNVAQKLITAQLASGEMVPGTASLAPTLNVAVDVKATPLLAQ